MRGYSAMQSKPKPLKAAYCGKAAALKMLFEHLQMFDYHED